VCTHIYGFGTHIIKRRHRFLHLVKRKHFITDRPTVMYETLGIVHENLGVSNERLPLIVSEYINHCLI